MSHGGAVESTPLTPAQIQALVAVAGRELSWGLGVVARELRRCRRAAARIPDELIRRDALDALDSKRTNTDGAAVFSGLLDHRNAELARLLAVYQAIWDFLDSLNERHPTEANGRELHCALIDALEPDGPRSDYYKHHPHKNDGGYLAALVEICRERCRALPSYEQIRPLVVQEARRAQVQALNHLADRADRDGALRRWAVAEFPDPQEIEWFEITAAASASLVILPLLALGGKVGVTSAEVAATRSAYWPWVSLATTMLDNFADRAEDVASGNHNYFTHYSDPEDGVQRLCRYISRSICGVRALPQGERHAVIVGSMVAMYLSKANDKTPESRRHRRNLAWAGGSLVRLLVPILRTWRGAYGQRSN